jgi:phosphopantothenoylcysteine decarboxylase/phosphopantothenate--cysteine ligase
VTSGPTHEPIDPVRYIANRSSGAQGNGDRGGAGAAGRAGELCDRGLPPSAALGVEVVRVETAGEMLAAVCAALPADAAVMAAAVATGAWSRPPAED